MVNDPVSANEPRLLLPDRQELLERLSAVRAGAPYGGPFYEHVARSAGEVVTPWTVAWLFIGASAYLQFTGGGEDLPQLVPRWIDAVIDEPLVASAAKDHWAWWLAKQSDEYRMSGGATAASLNSPRHING